MAKRKVKQITRVALVVDRSGSMTSIVNQARSGLKEQIESIRKNADKCDETYVSIISFDDEIITHVDNVNVNNLKEVNADAIIQPRGMTAMNDAVMKAIDSLQSKRNTTGTGYLVVVISDGEENASKTKSTALSERIKGLEATGQWTFTFMLANQDIHKAVDRLGIKFGNVSSFNADAQGTTVAYAAMGNSTNAYFDLRSRGVTQVNNFYTDVVEDKKKK